jgi:hypothetical protein
MSISANPSPPRSSGKPSLTPAGHARKWSLSPSMRWNKGDVFDPSSYSHLLGPLSTSSSSTSSASPPVAVVHTLGILLEADYKPYIRSGDVIGLAKAVLGGGEHANPLRTRKRGKDVAKSYDAMNRDSGRLSLRPERMTSRADSQSACLKPSSSNPSSYRSQRTPRVTVTDDANAHSLRVHLRRGHLSATARPSAVHRNEA